MEKKWIEHIRCHYEIPASMTDEDIGQIEDSLKDLPQYSAPIRVANFIELTELRKSFFPTKPLLGIFPTGFDTRWQGLCERLFLEGYYGPCCIWVRATVELMLQELCLLNPNVDREFKERIRGPGQNPGIGSCLSKLGGALSEEDQRCCQAIANRGDWVVHHRLDEIMGGRTLKGLLRGWGVAEKNLDAPGFKDSERQIMQANRINQERTMAKESMEQLYGFLSRRK